MRITSVAGIRTSLLWYLIRCISLGKRRNALLKHFCLCLSLHICLSWALISPHPACVKFSCEDRGCCRWRCFRKPIKKQNHTMKPKESCGKKESYIATYDQTKCSANRKKKFRCLRWGGFPPFQFVRTTDLSTTEQKRS